MLLPSRGEVEGQPFIGVSSLSERRRHPGAWIPNITMMDTSPKVSMLTGSYSLHWVWVGICLFFFFIFVGFLVCFCFCFGGVGSCDPKNKPCSEYGYSQEHLSLLI